MSTFITPPEFSGTGELTASTGLSTVHQGRWLFSQAGYNDGITFGVSIGWPTPEYSSSNYGAAPPPSSEILSAGRLRLEATNWPIPDGNSLTSYTDPSSGQTYSAEQCQILITGAWSVLRGVNSNSYNSFGVLRSGRTHTDQGSRDMDPWLLSYTAPRVTYVIQGSAVTGGAQNTFASHVFFCDVEEAARGDNSNFAFQSNTVVRPAWAYSYVRRWQIN